MRTEHTKALCIVVANPLVPEAAQRREVAPGATIQSLVPSSPFPQVCRLNGGWLLRAGWEHELEAGEVVEFYSYPQGGGDGGSDPVRAILMIAAIYVAVQFGQPWLFKAAGGALSAAGAVTATGALSWTAAGALATVAASSIVNVLVPASAAGAALANSSVASNTYVAALSGNQARLEAPVPVLYGRNRTFPDFAGEPYVTYDDETGDQFFHALYCVGQGNYVFESKLIDETNLLNFVDYVCRELPPGVQPTLVKGNIVNSAEVTGNEVVEDRYTGPYIACRPRYTCKNIGIDIGFSRGLATYDSAGNPGNMTVTWRVEYRAVDDFGRGLTPWEDLATESLTAASTKPIRKSYTYDLPLPPGVVGPPSPTGGGFRPQIRLVRTSAFDDNSRVANTIEWIGLKCELSDPAPLCPTATHVELRMRANEQLSAQSQRKFSTITRRLLRTWHPDTGWSGLVQTRNPAWALADKWTNPVYGDGYDDARCDLETLYRYSLTWLARQDRFDGVFDQTYASLAADQMIAQAGRAAVFRRNTVMTVSRDQLRDTPVTAFTARNIQPGSVNIEYSLANEITPDGVIVEYWDNRAWDWYDITCPAPGVGVPIRPQRLRLFGITGSKHAQREGLYHAANNFYRRRFASFATELEGMIPSFGSAAVFAPSLPGWGRGGDVVEYDTTTKVMKVSEPLIWRSGAAHYISLIKSDGSLDRPILVNSGPGEFEVTLTQSPSQLPVTKSATLERTRYVFGVGQPYNAVIRILGLRNSADDAGVRTYTVDGVLEDDRVHTADAHLLPVGGEIQDPVASLSGSTGSGTPNPDDDPNDTGDSGGNGSPEDTGDIGDGGGLGGVDVPLVVRLDPFEFFWGPGAATPEEEVTVSLRLTSDGFLVLVGPDGNVVVPQPEYDPRWHVGRPPVGNWLLSAPWTTAETGLYEARLTPLFDQAPGGSALSTWLVLNVDRQWSVTAVGREAVEQAIFKLEIRKTSTGTIQASADFKIIVAAYQHNSGT